MPPRDDGGGAAWACICSAAAARSAGQGEWGPCCGILGYIKPGRSSELDRWCITKLLAEGSMFDYGNGRERRLWTETVALLGQLCLRCWTVLLGAPCKWPVRVAQDDGEVYRRRPSLLSFACSCPRAYPCSRSCDPLRLVSPTQPDMDSQPADVRGRGTSCPSLHPAAVCCRLLMTRRRSSQVSPRAGKDMASLRRSLAQPRRDGR